MSIRVYLPLTSTMLAELAAAGRLSGPLGAHAVTEVLRRAWSEADEESWEFAAVLAAGEESWARRGAGDRPRRMVLVAEVGQVRPVTDGGADAADEVAVTRVELAEDVVLKQVASILLDAEDVVGEPDFDEPLAWFATQELPHLL